MAKQYGDFIVTSCIGLCNVSCGTGCITGCSHYCTNCTGSCNTDCQGICDTGCMYGCNDYEFYSYSTSGERKRTGASYEQKSFFDKLKEKWIRR